MAPCLFLCLFLFFPHLYASFSSSGSHSCSLLIQFKNSFSITEAAYSSCGPKSYPKTNSWKEGTDCCSWDGVTCDHLNAHFTSLFYLNLSYTGFVGEVPSQVSHLSKLVLLDLSSWPAFSMQYRMDKHALEGLVHNLTEVRHLFLDGMDMSSVNAHVFMNLSSSLRSLSLAGCGLQGKFPKNIFDLPNLNLLYMGGNQLSGQIPRSLGNLLQLTQLDLSGIQLSLSDNLLNGTLPSWLYTAPSLKTIYLSQNQFSGHIKEFQSKSLERIWLENNKLQGPLPSSIFQLLNLTSLALSSNNLSGVIEFSMFSNLPNLKYLHLSCNSLSLTFNTTSTHFPWKNIEFLDLSSNLISGNLPIPASTINVFLISNNRFNGEVSSLICNASSLQILDLSHNNLSGTIPQCFGNLSNSLEFLNLKKNKFYGTIPPTFAEGCQLTNFNLNGNLLEGPLTPSILNCKGLEVLDLGNNKINDTFPHWLGSLPQLQVLVLKSNHMHGPLCVNSSKSSPFFSKIQIFDLSSNYFSGPLPVRYINSFKAIINLEKIGSTMSYMGMNDPQGGFYTYSIGIVMKGQFMELVKIFTMWMIIDLSNYQFEGGIPKVIGKLNLLKGLNLSHNNLNGGIPTSIGNLTKLEWLDLSSNRLSRTIPNRLADLPFLSSFNVSDNQLHGQIPQGKQFNTFGNDSYEGNKGLCGFPVSKGCNIIEPAPPNVLEKDGPKSNITFGWKVVLIGYGCGVVFGMSVEYVVFQTGKPKWLVNLVEIQHEKK
ncbi:hypothetical protein ERO13_D05G375900v2 [Gossypium hirsutum]|nr:hypothetical protein ERO13_D05G375900v2 [Gossypium hirsutum]